MAISTTAAALSASSVRTHVLSQPKPRDVSGDTSEGKIVEVNSVDYVKYPDKGRWQFPKENESKLSVCYPAVRTSKSAASEAGKRIKQCRGVFVCASPGCRFTAKPFVAEAAFRAQKPVCEATGCAHVNKPLRYCPCNVQFTWTWEAGHAAQDCDILLEVSGDHNHPIPPDCKMPVAPRRYAAQMMEATNMGPMQAMVAGLADTQAMLDITKID